MQVWYNTTQSLTQNVLLVEQATFNETLFYPSGQDLPVLSEHSLSCKIYSISETISLSLSHYLSLFHCSSYRMDLEPDK